MTSQDPRPPPHPAYRERGTIALLLIAVVLALGTLIWTALAQTEIPADLPVPTAPSDADTQTIEVAPAGAP